VTPAVTPVFLKYFLCSILLTIVCSSTSDYLFDIFITRVKNHTFPKIEDKIVVLEESLGISHNRKTVSISSCFDVFTDSVNIHIIIQKRVKLLVCGSDRENTDQKNKINTGPSTSIIFI
jgi:hypothetical protein